MGAPEYSPQDIEAIMTHYPQGGAKAAKAHMRGGHSLCGIRGKAKRLGVKRNQAYRRKEITKELLRDLELAYRDGQRGAVKRTAEKHDVDYGWLKYVASSRGFAAGKHQRFHPDAAALLEEWEGLCPKTIQKRLRQAGFKYAMSAIVWQMQRRQLSIEAADAYTMTQLAELLGIDHGRVRRWIDSGRLRKQKRANWHGQAHHYTYVTPRALRDFVLAHPGEIDLRKIPPAHQVWFIDMLTNKLADAA